MTPIQIEETDATRAVDEYAAGHRGQAVSLPEFVDTVAESADTSIRIAKWAVFRFIDRGGAQLTPDFHVQIAG